MFILSADSHRMSFGKVPKGGSPTADHLCRGRGVWPILQMNSSNRLKARLAAGSVSGRSDEVARSPWSAQTLPSSALLGLLLLTLTRSAAAERWRSERCHSLPAMLRAACCRGGAQLRQASPAPRALTCRLAPYRCDCKMLVWLPARNE